MIVTVFSRITLCADDVMLLDRMAAAAGKSRDGFLSDYVFHMLTVEREFMKRTANKGVSG